jgi:putative DNA primase/helicase
VVIAFDADQPGVMYAEKYAGPSLVKVAKSVRILTWPDYMGRRDDDLWPEDHGQDLTDFFVQHRKAPEDLQDLIAEAKHFELPDEPAQPQALEFFTRGVGSERLSFKPRLLAEAIIKKKALLSDPETGLLYRWNGRYWESYHSDHVKRIAVDMLGEEAMTSRVNDAVTQVLLLATIPHGRKVNDMTEWSCLKNGMLNYKTLEMREHSKEYFATYELNVSLNPDSQKVCQRWLQYLSETIQTPEAIAQVQEFFGYCLLRDVPFAKVLLVLGPGSDGKSKLIKILREMVGPENTSNVGFTEMEDQFMRSSLYQKTVNISTEVGAKAIESPYFKAISAGDPINAAFKHKNTFNFVPYCKLIFAANRLPRVLDNSDGFYRRILPVLFKRQFLEDNPDTDPFLEEKLMAELSDIFQWALVGLHRLLKNGKFTDCDETRELLQDYRRLNSPVICFVDDVCALDEGSHATKKDLFEKYQEYSRESGNLPYAKEKFFRELYAAVNTLKSCRRRLNGQAREYCVQGIRLNLAFGA